jgi:hypothetical protein
MPQTAKVRPLAEAASDICGALEHAVPPALAAAARLRRCVVHEADIRPPPAGLEDGGSRGGSRKQKDDSCKASTSGRGGGGAGGASDDKVAVGLALPGVRLVTWTMPALAN